MGEPTEGHRPARLVIADDHALVRSGLKSMLAAEPDLEVVGEAGSGEEAVELCRRLIPDLVLMDVRMPGAGGLAATRRIKDEHPRTSVVIVTAQENPDYLFEALKAGAAGYVLKDATQEEFTAALRRVFLGESTLDQDLATRLLKRMADEERLDPSPKTRNRSEKPLEALTAREAEILRLMARGLTNRQIAGTLFLGATTVKTHVHRIIVKLGVSDRTQAAVRASELGLLTE